ncbi:hypothetical protein ACFO3U_09390 [Flavobacterium ponti]|uniref:Uncharacterized protein n=1 Tax=Flavobacterium ponti TaxID=665133 RepID=A0ABV9P498_9FLAO
MKIFPTKEIKFRLIDNQEDTLERLKRRTEYSKNFISSYTDKSFRGIIKNNTFKIISSEIGKGALCVMSGKIENKNGFVNLEVNKAFKVLFSILFILPIVAIIFQTITNPKDIIFYILVAIGQLFIIRFIFITIFFSKMYKHSINRLRDVLDIEYY